MLNQVVLTGNLGRDPEVRYSSTGTAITSFSICFKASKNKDVWIDVVLFGKIAESAGQHLHKGARVGIIGMLDENSWEDQNGNTKRKFQVIGNSVEYIKTNKEVSSTNSSNDRGESQQAKRSSQNNFNNNFDKDISF